MSKSADLTTSLEKLRGDVARWQGELQRGVQARTHVVGMVTKGLSQFEVALRHLLLWYLSEFAIDYDRELRPVVKDKEPEGLTLGEVVTVFDNLNARLTQLWRAKLGAVLPNRKLLTPAEISTLRYTSKMRKALHREDMEQTLVANAKEILASIEAAQGSPLFELVTTPNSFHDKLVEDLRSQIGEPTEIQLADGRLGSVWVVAGLEIAVSRDLIPERQLRGAWRHRESGRGIALLWVAKHPTPGKVWVVGPSGDSGPPRAVDAESLASEIVRIQGLPERQAAAQLEEALGRLERAVIRGVLVRGLLTNHFVERRLPAHRAELEGALGEPSGRDGWRGFFGSFGYDIATRRQGHLLSASGHPIAYVLPMAERSHFGRITEHGTLPEGRLVHECNVEGVQWGILAAADTFRLYHAGAEVGAKTQRWLEIDADALGPDWRFLLGLLAPDSLRAGGLLEEFVDGARDFGGDLHRRMERQIRETTLPHVARGLGDWLSHERGADLDDPAIRAEIQNATHTFLFRLMFLLYAESAGYLPIHATSYRPHSATTMGREAHETGDRADPDSATFWDRLRTLVHAVRTGNRAWGVHAYNGSLFAEDDLPGARLLEDATVTDDYLAPALEAIAFDQAAPEEDAGVDYAGLEIGHLGAMYEGLLALSLSRARESLAWDEQRNRFVPSEEPGEYGVAAGELFFQTEAGERKGGGVFYTRQDLVRHLVSHSVMPMLEEHLETVRERARHDPAGATRLLLDFRVLDPAMGSAHFLVDALDVIEDRLQTFLAEVPLPAIGTSLDELRAEAGDAAEGVEDGQLLRRLVLKHCLYGVDLSGMAVEIGRVSLWLASFVPGLTLPYLGYNLKQGDALVGVASLVAVGRDNPLFLQPGTPVPEALHRAAEMAKELAELQDRTPQEVRRSRELAEELNRVEDGVRRAFHCWTAHAFGVNGARPLLAPGAAEQLLSGDIDDRTRPTIEESQRLAAERSFFHWPIAFPEVFDPASDSPGFDAVIGNPPWNEVTIERLGFMALHDPGLRGLTSEGERNERIARLLERFPDLEEEFERRQAVVAELRGFFRPENGYEIQGGGDVDLYQLFSERYGHLCRPGGRLGVVLPRSAFLTEGSRGFRRWLFRECKVERIDFLLNRRSWAFPIHPQYTIALLAAQRTPPQRGATLRTTGPSASAEEFTAAREGEDVPIAIDELARWTPAPAEERTLEPSWEVPLLPSAGAARVFAKIRAGPRFDRWAQTHGGVFAAAEFHETQNKSYFKHRSGTPVWKGRSFDQYDPHGRDPAGHADWDEALAFMQRKRTSRRSSFQGKFPPAVLRDPSTHPVHKARLVFRDVSRATDSRTARAALVPPRIFLTNSAPYLVFPSGQSSEAAYVLGVVNSLPFDYQARRYVETHLNFFVLNLLCLPDPEATDVDGIALRAARLSCMDERFPELAGEAGVECGPLTPEQRGHLRAEIDALVAHACGLDAEDLEVVFADFTLDAVALEYRELVRESFRRLGGR